jgi:hypothetical protein
MKTTNVAVVALGAAVMAALLAYPAFATTAQNNISPTTTSGSAPAAAGSTNTAAMAPIPKGMHPGPGFRGGGRGPFGQGGAGQTTTFTNGQTITLTSTKGEYFVVGSNGKTNGTASGTLTFTVTGKLTAGYILNVGGSLTVNGTTYNVTSGSALMGPGGSGIQGQGATSASGSFIVRASARGDFSGTTTSTVSLDFSNGTTEYAVFLTGSIQG